MDQVEAPIGFRPRSRFVSLFDGKDLPETCLRKRSFGVESGLRGVQAGGSLQG